MTRSVTTYEYDGELDRVVDGDTAYIKVSKSTTHTVDFGFNVKTTFTVLNFAVIDFRLLAIDAPELRGIKKLAGEKAKEELISLLTGAKLRIVTSKMGKYGRWLARIYVIDADGSLMDVNQHMIDGGFAVPYPA